MSMTDDPVKIDRRKTTERLSRRQELTDTAMILSTVEGRRFYWKLMEKCGIHQSSFTGNNTTFFNEGQRNIGLQLLADLQEADPDAYVKCLREAKLEETKNA